MKKFRYLDESIQLQLDSTRCIGCGICCIVCPHRVFAMKGEKAEIADYEGCMECGACVINCPSDAIFVNPDDGCGCATLIINSWLTKVTGKKNNSCCS